MLRYLHGDDYSAERAWQLVDWLASRGASEFTMSFLMRDGLPAPALDRVSAALQPHVLPRQSRDRMEAYGKDELRRPTDLWALNSDTLRVLHECFPNGPLAEPTYAMDGWFENLELYRGGHTLFGMVNHEREGMLNLSIDEAADLAAEGFPTRDSASWI